MIAQNLQDNIEIPETRIADAFRELEKEVLQNYKDALDRAAHKNGAPSVETLTNSVCELSKRILDMDEDTTVPGGISTGTEISLKDRHRMGEVPKEIKSEKTLIEYKARYDKLCHRKDELRAILREITSDDTQKGNDNTNKIVFIITSGVIAPSTIVTTIAAVCGNDDKVFLLSLFGSTMAIGAGVAVVAIKRNSAMPKAANDISSPTNPKILKKFSACKNLLTGRGRQILQDMLKSANFLFYRGKAWTKNQGHKMPVRVQNFKKQLRIGHGNGR